MRLGIDFGTSRTVVACCDRGNYPVVTFEGEDEGSLEFYPSLVAERSGELRFGLEAARLAGSPGWTVTRSFKRLLGGPGCSSSLELDVGSTRMPLGRLLVRFFEALREAVLHRSNAPRTQPDEPLEAVLAVPANAHSAQRFLTLECARAAGFRVRALLNEPSAAGFEYTHRYRKTITSKREHVVVYDLGGGTFDASLVRMSGKHHDAIATGGVAHLGGDDFDEELVELVLAEAGLAGRDLPYRALLDLADQCRDAKERLNPSSRKITVDVEASLGAGSGAATREITLPVQRYYDRCVPLVERTIEAMLPVIARLEREEGPSPKDEVRAEGGGAVAGLKEIAGIYVVGGASSLPVVARVLRERFGRRVHRSPYPSAATAIGLAIAADETAEGFELTDRLSRAFGVFREARGGSGVTFDPIFNKDLKLPSSEPVVLRRVYRAAHNLGCYRFVECAIVGSDGEPVGEITPYPELFFPFDPSLRDRADLRGIGVQRTGGGPMVEERYSVSPAGVVSITITDLDTGFARAFQLGS